MVRLKQAAASMAGMLLGALLASGTPPASAQTPEVVRVRGEVVSFDGASTLVVKSRQGTDVTVRLGQPLRLLGVTKASVADIKPGVFIGTTTVQKEGSSSRSLEIHIFPESLRGTGEGDRPWDLVPGSSMTNGAAGNAVDSVDGKTITVTYQGGSRTVLVQPDTAIVTYVPIDKNDVKPGVKIFAITQKGTDGTLTASALSVGKDGVTPPM
ncbi:MAG: hypothetical protein JOY67_09635 [Hyphomicrobiales bacterium]|nr:hypothetical protein [Hyphomicrobiales bacterium]